MSENIKMTRSEVNQAVSRFLKNGGKITKLPDGPNHRFQPYGVRVTPSDPKVDVTVTEDPANKEQEKAMLKESL